MTAPDRGRPQPVVDAAELAGDINRLIVGVGTALVVLGAVTDGQVQTIALATGAGVTAVGAFTAKYLPVLRARRAAAQVTPLSDPRDAAGRPLTAAGRVVPQRPGVADHAAPEPGD